LTKSNSWIALETKIIDIIQSSKYGTQEAADINTVNFIENGVVVDGYQSYKIQDGKLTPIASPDNKLWSTEKKYEIVSKAMALITSREEIKSFLDIGSNLGLYVFNSSVNFKIDNSTGYDYNIEYIKVCREIQKGLNLSNCSFEQKGFAEIDKSFDCVVAMAIIHHLYHRTETWGSLDKLMKKFSEITNKYLIVEFPTENDPKASRWTRMVGRDIEETYSHENFLTATSKYFSSYEIIGKIGETRVTYLLKK
jgi:2-polyprenyl-3-methyl-5-hydroxy-6-metoxy-1,4-benzoquinol methylase